MLTVRTMDKPRYAPHPIEPDSKSPADVREWLWAFLQTDPNLEPEIIEVLEEGLIRHQSAGDSEDAANKDVSKIDSLLHEFGEEEIPPIKVVRRIHDMGPDVWGYPASDWDDVKRICELQDLGLSRMQAIVHLWKENGLTHEEIAGKTDRKKATIDTHSRRINGKVKKAKRLVEEVDVE